MNYTQIVLRTDGEYGIIDADVTDDTPCLTVYSTFDEAWNFAKGYAYGGVIELIVSSMTVRLQG